MKTRMMFIFTLALVSIAIAQTASFAGYSSVVLADNPAAYWRLEEAGPSVMADLSGNSRNGEYVGSWTYQIEGAIASENSNFAVSKTGGSANRMRADDSAFTPNTDPSSIELWVKTASTSGYVFTWYSNSYAFRFLDLQSDGTLRWRARDKDGTNISTIYGTKVVNDGTWHHVVATEDATTDWVNLYVDGALDGASNSVNLVTLDGSGWLHYGGFTSDPGIAISASYDELAYYTYELSAAKVLSHYQAAVPEPSGALMLGSGLIGLIGFVRRRLK